MLQGEEDEENDGDQDDEGDGFFVPHGYLSEGEGCDDDEDEGKVIGDHNVSDGSQVTVSTSAVQFTIEVIA